jgi:hypothetical protein
MLPHLTDPAMAESTRRSLAQFPPLSLAAPTVIGNEQALRSDERLPVNGLRTCCGCDRARFGATQ